MDWNVFFNTILTWVTNTGVKIIISIIILIISFKIINVLCRKIERKSVDKKSDKTILKTLAHILKIGLKVLVAVCLVGYLGIDTSGITALVTSLGVCVGLALNGALSNFAGGVLLIFTRPFKLDDYIEAQGYSGTVQEINITNTKLLTFDNKVVYIPNGTLANGEITNYTEKELRRVDLVFSIGYGDDFEKAKNVIIEICDNHELILKDPAPFIRVTEHGASSINISTRVWVKTSDYWSVYYDMFELVKKGFDEAGIEIPFNQLDVHVKND